MKHKYLLSIILIAAVSCGKDPDPGQPEFTTEQNYIGTVSVEYKGDVYDTENITVTYEPSQDGKTADITIYEIKFVPQMPVTVDVTIPSVPLVTSQSVTSFSGNDIIPQSMGGEVPKYLVTDLNGSIEGDEIHFSLNFGEYPTAYSGRRSESR